MVYFIHTEVRAEPGRAGRFNSLLNNLLHFTRGFQLTHKQQVTSCADVQRRW